MRIGFEVPTWTNKAMRDYTNEEILEYWHKLRTVTKSGEVDTSDYSRKGLSTDFWIVDAQQNIISRMENKASIEKIQQLRELVYGVDIPSATCPEYIEHHRDIQKILKFIDKELLGKEV